MGLAPAPAAAAVDRSRDLLESPGEPDAGLTLGVGALAAGEIVSLGYLRREVAFATRPGRESDLLEAVAACDEGLCHRPEMTSASNWASLAVTRKILALRLARVQRGHEVRHHPGPNARRRRALRFTA